MAISDVEFKKEEKILNKVNTLLDETYNTLADDVKVGEEDLIEFKKMMWSDSNSFDEGEITQVKAATALEADKFFRKQDYLRRLKMIKDKPYFASIVFKDDKDNSLYNIYMSLTYLKDKNSNNILYDWRSPICSLFYDYETGPASYTAPGGIYSGELKRKRQYKIENKKLVGVFDNSLNIDDEVLQEVLANESSDHMKNVVNTIQQEQNKVIRNLEDNNLIVQGIAGSGKTTVALHRIAFLLYRLDNLNSNNVLIFSPNNIFTDYISEVLPSLGEANTLQTTFADYLESFITEYNHVEDFTDFVSRFYSYKETFPELVEYKQSDRIIDDLDAFIEDYISNCLFTSSFNESEKYYIVMDDLNYMLHDKYDRLPLFERMEEIASKLSSNNYKGSNKKKATYLKLMYENCNFKHDIKSIMKEFYLSEFCRFKLDEKTINSFINTDSINYEDALVFAYLKGRLEGFIYDGCIRQVVIDEAQDYNRLQYIIINEIFKKADFTILGDINQNINPYYHYDSLEELSNLFNGETKYIELLKTYRSSPEIINYTNKILNLNHVNAIRKTMNKPVIIRKGVEDIRKSIIDDISKLKREYKSVCVITKDMREAEVLYDLVKDSLEISLVDHNTKSFHKDLVIMPAYVSKGLEFDSVIVYNNRDNSYKNNERNLLYVACTRAQHELYIYN